MITSKLEIANQKIVKEESEFPCLRMGDNNLIVLFTGPESGFVLAKDNNSTRYFGEYDGNFVKYSNSYWKKIPTGSKIIITQE